MIKIIANKELEGLSLEVLLPKYCSDKEIGLKISELLLGEDPKLKVLKYLHDNLSMNDSPLPFTLSIEATNLGVIGICMIEDISYLITEDSISISNSNEYLSSLENLISPINQTSEVESQEESSDIKVKEDHVDHSAPESTDCILSLGMLLDLSAYSLFIERCITAQVFHSLTDKSISMYLDELLEKTLSSQVSTISSSNKKSLKHLQRAPKVLKASFANSLLKDWELS